MSSWGDVGHRELDGIVKAALSRFLRDGPAVGSDADEPAFALALGLQQAPWYRPFSSSGSGNRLDVVQLHDVHIIGAEHAKALVKSFGRPALSLAMDLVEMTILSRRSWKASPVFLTCPSRRGRCHRS